MDEISKMGSFGNFCFLCVGVLEREPPAMTNSVIGFCRAAISLFFPFPFDPQPSFFALVIAWMSNLVRAMPRLQFCLEHFQKCCNHSVEGMERAIFLNLGFRLRQGYGGQVVSAQSQGFSNLLLRRSLAQAQKSPLRTGYNIFSNAL